MACDDESVDLEEEKDYFTISVRLPVLKELSETSMEYWFDGLDGRWSQQTKDAIRHAKAGGLDLNGNWARTLRSWVCPACRRGKPEIFRASVHGILIGKIERHHDHIADLFLQRLRECIGGEGLHNLAENGRRAPRYVRALLVRFPDTLLCADCNTADGEAKRVIGAEFHKHLSCTPSEIGQFIQSGNNRPHSIDRDKCRAVWQTAKRKFEDRLEFLDLMVRRLADGQHDTDGIIGADLVDGAWDRAQDAVINNCAQYGPSNTRYREWRSGFQRDLEALSVSNDSAGLTARRRRQVHVRQPTDDEFRLFETENSQVGWRKTNEAWRCPCCNRGKREIMRISKTRRWSGQIVEYPDYKLASDIDFIRKCRMLYGSGVDEHIISSTENILICWDCRDVSSLTKRNCPDLGDIYLRPSDITSCVSEFLANSSHQIDFEAARASALKNEPLVAGIRAFEMHGSVAALVRAAATIRSEVPPFSGQLRELVSLKLYERGIDVQMDDQIIHWLWGEANRLR